MLCPRLIVISAATAIMLAAGQAHAQSADELRPTIWDAEDEIAGGETAASTAESGTEPVPPPGADIRQTLLEVSPAEPLPPLPRRRIAEDDAYAPLGWRIGNMTAFFALETGANFTDNVQQSNTGRKSDIGLLLAPKFNIESDWSRHKFTAQGNGQFVRYRDESDYDTEEAEARAELRLEVLRTTAIDLAGFYILTQDTASAIDVPDDAIGTRNESFYGASIALEQITGDFTTRLKTGVSREYYGDVTLPNNTVDSNTDQNYYELGFSWRTTYAPTPNLRPFVELAYLPRHRDKKEDRNGLSRSSDGYAATLGVGFDPSPIWSGEFGLIYMLRDYDDPALDPLATFGPIGRVTWRPTALTDLTLSAATYLDEATDPNSSGTRNWAADLDLVHALRENLKLLAGVGVTYQDTQGIDVTDVTLDANLGLTWQITRWLAWKADYDFTWFNSNLENSDYTENQVSVGLEIRN
ncbi:MAG: outer membrane beta-barrel protein [Rhizobiales bacterium]|nr:outer membrane beta-barrel protein [Hyphomicrobiales bacterium]